MAPTVLRQMSSVATPSLHAQRHSMMQEGEWVHVGDSWQVCAWAWGVRMTVGAWVAGVHPVHSLQSSHGHAEGTSPHQPLARTPGPLLPRAHHVCCAQDAVSSAAQPFWHSFLAGASCGFVNVALNQVMSHNMPMPMPMPCSSRLIAPVAQPFDVVKTKLMNQNRNAPAFSGVIDCMKQTVQGGGISALWSGSVPRIARQLPAQGITFGMFNLFARALEGGQ